MKKLLFLFVLCLSYSSSFGLEISVDVGCFKNEGQSYMEAYIRILGQTVEFKENKELGGLQAGVELTMIISQGDKIITYEKFKLNSPLFGEPQDFLDVKRFALADGEYILKVEAVDGYDEDNKLDLEKRVVVSSFSESLAISDVQLFASVKASDPSNPLSKNGLLMEPLTYGYVSKDINVLNIYSEVYRSTELETMNFVRYAIMDGYSNGPGEVAIQKFKKLEGKENEPLLLQLPVNELPSGKYHVLIELFDKSKNTLASKKVDFIRANPDYDIEYWKNYNKEESHSFVSDLSKEELDYALRAISALVYEPKKSVMNFIIADAPMRAQRKFLLDFWNEEAPRAPELAYQKFMEVAKAIDIEFNSNVGYGFETDRGYMFLRYGKPSNILSIDTEPDSYPYEIWYYNYLKETNQTNVRFIFYNKSLSHNDYTILHSTCIGERQYPQWEVELYRRALDVQELNQIEAQTIQDSWQRNARRYFNDF
ncbi:MAG: GWxTD domain-containing protein [Bacteroidota bacterium]